MPDPLSRLGPHELVDLPAQEMSQLYPPHPIAAAPVLGHCGGCGNGRRVYRLDRPSGPGRMTVFRCFACLLDATHPKPPLQGV